MDEAAAELTFAMPAIHVWLHGTDLLADPVKCALVAEYAVWDEHIADWRSRRPPMANGRRAVSREWLTEGQDLFAHLDAMRSVVRHAGFLA